jgi:hypothetical protein
MNWINLPFYYKACTVCMNLLSITLNEAHYKEIKELIKNE